MSNSAIPNIDIIKQSIHERHLEQLSRLDLIVDPLDHLPIRAGFNDLEVWTKESKAQITAGIKNRVYGGQSGSPIDFNNAFMAFMESAAMYLRDTTKVVKAVKSYRLDRSNRAGLDLLEQSTAEIDRIADLWDMQFIQICDFVELHPDGHSWIVGPFCGAFIPKDFAGSSPFIGVAFKGTSVTMEIINDLSGASTLRPPDLLWGAQVSEGFYYPIFSTYGGGTTSEPFVLIQNAVQDIVTSAKASVITHVTGHSLGAAYATLTYSQLCISGFGTPIAVLGDLYTYGSPRTGRGDLAENVRAAIKPLASNADGSTWRVVNDEDYVPKVPASPPWPISTDPFVHVDAAYRIYADKKPMAEPSEIGTNPTWALPTALTPHYTTEYYKSLRYATTAKRSEVPLREWGNDPLLMPALSASPKGANITSLEWTKTVAGTLSLQTVQRQSELGSEAEAESEANTNENADVVVGSIAFHRFVGEITALGRVPAALLQLAAGAEAEIEVNVTETWKYLYPKERERERERQSRVAVLFEKVDGRTLDLRFVAVGGGGGEDGELEVARARVSVGDGELGDVGITRGSSVWSFRDTPDSKLANVDKDIADAAASVFDTY